PVSVAATRLARIAKEESIAEEPWKRGRGGTSIGRAVHAVLQTIDLAAGEDIEETARAQAAAEGIPQRQAEIARLARNAIGSDVVRRAVSSGRFWREVPVAVPMGDGVLEGFIDLLFEEDGSLVVVDYKTDSLDAEETADAVSRYSLQAGSYALAVQKATGKPVKEVVFLFLRSRREEVLTNIAQLAAEAESAAMSYLH
ncbi:MAG: PD-(D/E)XK nuclease family protein, partial [Chloroflexi bacterium]|nr:PD-(D/E)XK nuclease family protein [Chloroflexota bacterium]